MNTTPKSPVWTVSREAPRCWRVRLDDRCMYTARTKREAVAAMKRLSASGAAWVGFIGPGRSEVA